jgi:hypothetical protein
MNRISSMLGRCGQRRGKVKQARSRFAIEQNGKKREKNGEEERNCLAHIKYSLLVCMCVCARANEREREKRKVSLTKEQQDEEQEEEKESNINYLQNGRRRRRASTDRAPNDEREK